MSIHSVQTLVLSFLMHDFVATYVLFDVTYYKETNIDEYS
jgi:hypothetical protein